VVENERPRAVGIAAQQAPLVDQREVDEGRMRSEPVLEREDLIRLQLR
jgi:hypothetical protein